MFFSHLCLSVTSICSEFFAAFVTFPMICFLVFFVSADEEDGITFSLSFCFCVLNFYLSSIDINRSSILLIFLSIMNSKLFIRVAVSVFFLQFYIYHLLSLSYLFDRLRCFLSAVVRHFSHLHLFNFMLEIF